MHDYAIFNHSRATIGRYLGVVAFITASAFTSGFAALSTMTGYTIFAGASLTSAVVYFILHWSFNRQAWKLKWFDIPDISGVWVVRGETLEEDGSVKYHWSGELDICQKWEKISITQETKTSSSASYTATLEKRSRTQGGSILHYAYKNTPKIDQYQTLQNHTGYCEIKFDEDAKTGEAAYFNSFGRRTFGKMYLTKKEA
ncbi:pancortin-3 [Vibrio natriegens]|uniref:Cap15 family cyclic dinucleotide receptor domain-containing protein n=1 Tax=Vibrio natriegens TaxID=691 RepID=UPI0035562269